MSAEEGPARATRGALSKREPLRDITNARDRMETEDSSGQRLGTLSPRKRRPTSKAMETRELGNESLARRIEESVSQAVIEVLEHRLDEMQDKITEIEEAWRMDRALLEDITKDNKDMKALMEDQKVLITALGQQIEVLQVPQRTMPITYAAAAATNAMGRKATKLADNSTSLGPNALTSAPEPTATSSLFCTVEGLDMTEQEKEALPSNIRAGVEKIIRSDQKQPGWRCRAVIRDNRNPQRVRILCRDEEELKQVKKAAEQSKPQGGRVLGDQLYPVKMDSVAAHVILTPQGSLREDARARLEAENDVKIAKIVWLSNKLSRKAYGSMAVFFSSGEDAVQALQAGFFSVGGESAYTNIFEARRGPMRCYNCQELGHKAFNCKSETKCSKCSQKGHSYRDCVAEIPKCSGCGGPHETHSGHCGSQQASHSTPSQW